ncbi:MAG: sigma-70 family RNA polymerase sigma factor [Bryobacteraceae bacterium]|jgi:RNA polymerase sigma-70 factor (ECF subfamily)
MSPYPLGRGFVGIIGRERSGPALRERVGDLYEESRDDVYRYLLTLDLYPATAQEAAQEVFLRLYEALRKGAEIENTRAWVFRVAHNLGLKIRARQGGETPFDPGVGQRLAAVTETPESELMERERMLGFHRAVEGLSEQQRRCLFLRLEGLRYPEIGRALGISASAVGEFLRRATTRLRKSAL